MRVEVQGLKETLRELRKIDPALRKQIGKDIQRVVKPVAQLIDSRIPAQAPLSGWDHNGRKGWAPKKMSIRTDTRLPRRRLNQPGTSVVSVVRVVSKGSSVPMADMAGKAGGGTSRAPIQRRRPNFATALSAALGPPSRFVWRDIDDTIQVAQKELEPIIRQVEEIVNRDMMRIR